MAAWVVAGGAVVVGLLVVALTLVAERGRTAAPAGPSDARGLPTPEEVADPRLPLAWRGYAPLPTDAHLDRVAAAYAALYHAADDPTRALADAALGGGTPHDAGSPDAARRPVDGVDVDDLDVDDDEPHAGPTGDAPVR